MTPFLGSTISRGINTISRGRNTISRGRNTISRGINTISRGTNTISPKFGPIFEIKGYIETTYKENCDFDL